MTELILVAVVTGVIAVLQRHAAMAARVDLVHAELRAFRAEMKRDIPGMAGWLASEIEARVGQIEAAIPDRLIRRIAEENHRYAAEDVD